MLKQSLQCQPPCSNFFWSVCLFFFPPFHAQEKCISCSQHKTLIRHSTTDVTQRERRAIHFSCIHDCVLITSKKTPPACFSMSHMLTDCFPSLGEPFFYCSFTHLQRWRLQRGEIVCIPASPMTVGRLIISKVRS